MLLCTVLAAPPDEQHQNGLAERKWQTISRMARSLLTDKKIPRSFWFWAIRHATRLSNIFPVKYEGTLTTPFE